ncbi:MAG: hypothetical protein ACXABY_30510, partial [Candidatus Thorarchaeota archaeon]
METVRSHSSWYAGIENQINLLKDTLSGNEYKRYKLRLLLGLAERADEFYAECEECQGFQKDIKRFADNMGNMVQTADKGERRSYFKSMNVIVKHCQKKHKLVTEGQYMGIGTAIGTAVGMALGAAMEEVGGG